MHYRKASTVDHKPRVENAMSLIIDWSNIELSVALDKIASSKLQTYYTRMKLFVDGWFDCAETANVLALRWTGQQLNNQRTGSRIMQVERWPLTSDPSLLDNPGHFKFKRIPSCLF
jgi:hypothetical protein